MIQFFPSTRGSAARSAKLNEAKVAEILLRLSNGESAKALAAEYRVSPTTILRIKRREGWTHVPSP